MLLPRPLGEGGCPGEGNQLTLKAINYKLVA